MLQCGWVKSRPVLEVLPFNPGDGIPQQAAQSAADDPDRDFLGSVVLSPEQAMQEMAQAAADSAIRVAEGAFSQASNPRVATGHIKLPLAQQWRRAPQYPGPDPGAAEGGVSQALPPKSRFYAEHRKPLARSWQPMGVSGPQGVGTGLAGGEKRTCRDDREPGIPRAELLLKRRAREGEEGSDVLRGSAAAEGLLIGHGEGGGGVARGSSTILGDFESLAAEPTQGFSGVSTPLLIPAWLSLVET